MVKIEPAPATALEGVKTLLVEAGLPAEDLTAQHLRHFLVATDSGELVGGIGLEPAGATALLRSLVVTPGRRERGLGAQLAAAAESKAARDGIRQLYLLTTTAQGFFSKRGYEVIDRSDAPEGLQQTFEFREACPQTAVCMTRTLIPQ